MSSGWKMENIFNPTLIGLYFRNVTNFAKVYTTGISPITKAIAQYPNHKSKHMQKTSSFPK